MSNLVALLISWLVASALGVAFTALMRSKAAGFTLAYVLVAAVWAIAWFYSGNQPMFWGE